MTGTETAPEKWLSPAHSYCHQTRRGSLPGSARTCLGSPPRTRDRLWVEVVMPTRELVERVIIGRSGLRRHRFGNGLIVTGVATVVYNDSKPGEITFAGLSWD
jgi:hypothetical protein